MLLVLEHLKPSTSFEAYEVIRCFVEPLIVI